MMKKMAKDLIFGSRWLLYIFYLGLLAVLIAFAGYFIVDLIHIVRQIFDVVFFQGYLSHEEIVLSVLSVIEMVMIANLINIVKVGSFSIFISPMEFKKGDKPSWIDHIDTGALKVKMAMALVNIAGVYLLGDFIHAAEKSVQDILFRVGLYLTFVIGAYIMAKTDHILDPNTTHTTE